jgi:hypothetical protein
MLAHFVQWDSDKFTSDSPCLWKKKDSQIRHSVWIDGKRHHKKGAKLSRIIIFLSADVPKRLRKTIFALNTLQKMMQLTHI